MRHELTELLAHLSLKQSVKVFFPYDSTGRLDEKLINSNHRKTESNKQVETRPRSQAMGRSGRGGKFLSPTSESVFPPQAFLPAGWHSLTQTINKGIQHP